MRRLSLPALAGALAVVAMASLSATAAEARDCTFERWTNIPTSERPIFKCQEQVAKRMMKKGSRYAKMKKGSRYAQRAKGQRTARLNRGSNAWHGWAGSFHLDGARYPGGNPSGPASYYNNYLGGFHPTAFWLLSDRGRF
jgi:hypothetical protein